MDREDLPESVRKRPTTRMYTRTWTDIVPGLYKRNYVLVLTIVRVRF